MQAERDLVKSLDISRRPRRNRISAAIRGITQETRLHPANFIAPIFVIEGNNKKEPIKSMPGIFRLSIDLLVKEAVELFMNDNETDGIVMIGEIGGGMEAEAARWIKENNRKPVVGFIAGQTAPAGRRMGHAGAIVGGAEDTAAAKMKILSECGGVTTFCQ